MMRGYFKTAMHAALVMAILCFTAGASLAAGKEKAPAQGARAGINTKIGES